MTHDREQDDPNAGEHEKLSARGRLNPEALAQRTRQIAERHSPAYMVIEEGGDLVHSSGPTSPFLEPGTRAATFNLLDCAHRDLRDGLRIAVRKAETNKQPAMFEGVIGDGGPAAHVRVIVEPVEDDADDTSLFVVLFQQRHQAEDEPGTDTALRESEERFRMMVQTMPNTMFASRSDGSCEYINARFYAYTGMPEGSGLTDGWMRAVHPEDREPAQRIWRDAVAAGGCFETASRLKDANGDYRWFRCRAEPMRDANGEVVRWFGSCSDIHEYQVASERQRLLVAELQHRVKNILAVVRSIFTRSMEAADATNAGADHFRGRLDALARTQNVLTRTPEGGIDLEEMIHNELTCHGALHGQQVHIDGPAVRLRQKAAEALGLAVHELATNAAKYGALATTSGRIGVTWQLYESGAGTHLSWKWAESGVTLIDPAPARIGFGRELIEHGLPYQLGATTMLKFAGGGVSCAIELPLSERLAVLPYGDAEWRQP